MSAAVQTSPVILRENTVVTDPIEFALRLLKKGPTNLWEAPVRLPHFGLQRIRRETLWTSPNWPAYYCIFFCDNLEDYSDGIRTNIIEAVYLPLFSIVDDCGRYCEYPGQEMAKPWMRTLSDEVGLLAVASGFFPMVDREPCPIYVRSSYFEIALGGCVIGVAFHGGPYDLSWRIRCNCDDFREVSFELKMLSKFLKGHEGSMKCPAGKHELTCSADDADRIVTTMREFGVPHSIIEPLAYIAHDRRKEAHPPCR